jgi:hypothetical protein
VESGQKPGGDLWEDHNDNHGYHKTNEKRDASRNDLLKTIFCCPGLLLLGSGLIGLAGYGRKKFFRGNESNFRLRGGRQGQLGSAFFCFLR